MVCTSYSLRHLGNRHGSTRGSTALQTSPEAHGATHVLQRLWDGLLAGAELQDVENRIMEVEPELFLQASAWAKTFTPFRSVVAEVADRLTISVLVLPRKLLEGSRCSSCVMYLRCFTTVTRPHVIDCGDFLYWQSSSLHDEPSGGT